MNHTPAAITVAQRILNSDLYISNNLLRLDSISSQFFEHIAPVSISDTLNRIEGAFKLYLSDRYNSNLHSVLRIVSSIAYEERYFKRCARLLVSAALVEDISSRHRPNRDLLIAFYYRLYSCTLASIDERLEFLNEVWGTGERHAQEIAVKMMEAALEAWHFRPRFIGSFGSHSRSFGAEYKQPDELIYWYGSVLDVAQEISLGGSDLAPLVAVTLANRMRPIKPYFNKSA